MKIVKHFKPAALADKILIENYDDSWNYDADTKEIINHFLQYIIGRNVIFSAIA